MYARGQMWLPKELPTHGQPRFQVVIGSTLRMTVVAVQTRAQAPRILCRQVGPCAMMRYLQTLAAWEPIACIAAILITHALWADGLTLVASAIPELQWTGWSVATRLRLEDSVTLRIQVENWKVQVKNQMQVL